MIERVSYHAVMFAAVLGALLVAPLAGSDATTSFRLQSAGESWGSTRVWGRFNADQRSFRFKGISSRSCFDNRLGGVRIFSSPQANRGSTLRANLPAGQRTARRSWGNTARYSSRQRIISYRSYHTAGQANRGSTVGKRR